MSVEDVRRLIGEARHAPYGAGKIALAEEAIRLADALDDRRLRFDARMAGTEAYQMGGEPAKGFVTFSWCLAEYDRDPSGFDVWDDELLRWHFKWVVAGLRKFPEVPLSRTYAVLDDMQRRYRLGGHSMHAVHMLRWRLAHHIGDAEAAEHWYVRWCAAPRDENSDCRGCDPTSKVEHLAGRRRDEEAIALAAPVLAGRLTCAEQPHAMLTELLLPYLRTGRLAEARDAHLRGYRGVRRNLADLGEIGQHVEFCALTGNEVRGLEIVERHLDWLERAPSPYAAMNFAAAAALLLRRLVASGRGDLAVGGATVAALADRLAGTARELANRFDARNRTGHQGALVEARLAALPLVEHVPLSAVERATVAPPPPRARAAPDYPDRPAELLDLIDSLRRQYRIADAAAAWRYFAQRYPDGSLPPELEARRLDARAAECVATDRAEAERWWRAAAEAYAGAGDDARAAIARGRLGLVLCHADRVDDGLPLVEESSDRLSGHPDPERRLGALLRLAEAYLVAGRPDEALGVLDRAAAEPLTGLDAAELPVRRAQVLLALDRAEEAAAECAVARERYAELGDPPAAGMAALMHGHALLNLDGSAADAASAFRAALALTEEPQVALSAQQGAGRALLLAERPAEAVDHLVEAVAGLVAGGHEVPAAYSRYELAQAYSGGGQYAEAAEAAEEALAALDRARVQDAADRCRYLLSQVYRELDEPDLALTQLDALVVNLDGFDNLGARAQLHEEAAQLLYRLDRDAPAAHRFTAAAQAFAAAGARLDEVRARRWCALAWRWADQPERAESALDEADALAAALPSDEPAAVWERAMLRYDGSRVLIGADRYDDALTRLAGTATTFRSIQAFAEAVHAELLEAELLMRLERPGEAEPVLRAVLAGAPRDSAPHESAAWLLCDALDALGRTDEAAALRREYGIEQ